MSPSVLLGLLVLAASLLAVLLTLLSSWCVLTCNSSAACCSSTSKKKKRRYQKKGEPSAGDVDAAVRLAATRGDVACLEAIERTFPRLFDVDASTRDEFTSVQAAAVEGHAHVIEWLLARGAQCNANKKDAWSVTALHYAAANGHEEAVRVLLRHGADANARDFAGRTPADVSANSSSEVVSMLVCMLDYAGRQQQQQPPSQAIAETFATMDTTRHCVIGMITNDNHETMPLPPPITTTTSWWIAQSSDPIKRMEMLIARGGGGGADGDSSTSTTTSLRKGTRTWRVLAVFTQAAGIAYMVWRALYSFSMSYPIVSALFYISELAMFLPSFAFLVEMWTPIVRHERDVKKDNIFRKAVVNSDSSSSAVADNNKNKSNYPTCDVFIPCYSEPPEIVEATLCAALRLDWPGHKLVVHVLDDGKRGVIEEMVHRVKTQLKTLQYEADLRYIARPKVKGTPHHAKAGNINHALLSSGTRGEFVLILDCDMIVKRSFLRRTVGHFFACSSPPPHDDDGGGGGSHDDDDDDTTTNDNNNDNVVWVRKHKASFLQTPQDFYNLTASDPLGHRAAFFYGAMLQGRDGCGACPCVGTGVVFRRDALVSIGGQSYGSVTEDFNTAMALHANGFSSMYVNERLVYGLAPNDVVSAMRQRLRWATGSLQILARDNPLYKPGLTAAQRTLYFHSAAQYLLSLPTLMLAVLPLIYLFFGIAPIHANLLEFLVAFLCYYALNRILLWWAHRGLDTEEIWRGSQMSVWIAPTNLLAVSRIVVDAMVSNTSRAIEWCAGSRFRCANSSSGISFAVTAKQKGGTGSGGGKRKKKGVETNVTQTRCVSWWDAMTFIWPHVTYLLVLLAALVNVVVRHSMSRTFRIPEFASDLIALMWAGLVALYVWPPVAVALEASGVPLRLSRRTSPPSCLNNNAAAIATATDHSNNDDDEEEDINEKLAKVYVNAKKMAANRKLNAERVRDNLDGLLPPLPTIPESATQSSSSTSPWQQDVIVQQSPADDNEIGLVGWRTDAPPCAVVSPQSIMMSPLSPTTPMLVARTPKIYERYGRDDDGDGDFRLLFRDLPPLSHSRSAMSTTKTVLPTAAADAASVSKRSKSMMTTTVGPLKLKQQQQPFVVAAAPPAMEEEECDEEIVERYDDGSIDEESQIPFSPRRRRRQLYSRDDDVAATTNPPPSGFSSVCSSSSSSPPEISTTMIIHHDGVKTGPPPRVSPQSFPIDIASTMGESEDGDDDDDDDDDDDLVLEATPPFMIRNVNICKQAVVYSAAFGNISRGLLEQLDDGVAAPPASAEYEYVAYVAAVNRMVTSQPTLSRRPLIWLPNRRGGRLGGCFVLVNIAMSLVLLCGGIAYGVLYHRDSLNDDNLMITTG